jgi:hypothetical protein
MKKPNINNYPKIKDGKHQYYQDDINTYINYLEKQLSIKSIKNISDLLWDYEKQSAKPYPYNDESVTKKINEYLKNKEDANK